MKKKLKPIFFLFLSLFYKPEVYCQAAESIDILPRGNSLLIPVGRSFVDEGGFEIRLNGSKIPYEVVYDGYGGFWAQISTDELQDVSIIKVRYIRSKGTVQTFEYDSDIKNSWIKPSEFIDSDNPEIIEQALLLYDETKEIKENVSALRDFVTEKISFNQGFHLSPASLPASETLAQCEGVCINFSRLCIALCRACGIAARSISGIILNDSYGEPQEFHHEWMEYMDENGIWNPMDLTFTNTLELCDIRYFDLVFASEDHPLFKDMENDNLSSGKPFSGGNNEVILFHYHPLFPGAKFGFKLVEEHQPDFIIFEKTIVIKECENQIIIKQSSDSSTGDLEKLEYYGALAELKSQLSKSLKSEDTDEAAGPLPEWLMKLDGSEYIYQNRIFNTVKVRFDMDCEKNELLLTVYNEKNSATTLKPGLGDHYYLNKNENGLLIASAADFKENVIIWTTVIPEYNWTAKYTYHFSGDELEVTAVDINGTEFFTKGTIVR